jgi:hypothetical protein
MPGCAIALGQPRSGESGWLAPGAPLLACLLGRPVTISLPFVDEREQFACAGLVLSNSVWQRYQEVAVMKLEIARGLFLAAALGVASIAAAAWQEPVPEVLTRNSLGYCPLPPKARVVAPARPDHDLLLFLFSMSQGLAPRG